MVGSWCRGRESPHGCARRPPRTRWVGHGARAPRRTRRPGAQLGSSLPREEFLPWAPDGQGARRMGPGRLGDSAQDFRTGARSQPPAAREPCGKHLVAARLRDGLPYPGPILGP